MSTTKNPVGQNANGPEITVDVLIVGGGFSGLCMAIKLLEARMDSFLLLEKSGDIGGTWYDNRYPGCACDIPSHLYSFSFEPSPDWSRMYPGQPEIHAYLKRIVERHNLSPYIRLNTRFHEATWDESESVWHATAGEGMKIRARLLVSGIGGLHVPYYPQIKGIERFAGPQFHSSTWDHSIELEGKNVAVVGTGASAIQFVPQIASRAGKLLLFQRTPPWIVPRMDFPIADIWKHRFRRFPFLMKAFRQFIFWRQEIRVLGFLGNRFVRRKATEIATHNLEKHIKDPKLRAALKPNYELGCKRVLVSDDFYPALKRPNVELVTEAIAEIRPNSILTADGVERPVDVLILGTGFRATEPLIGIRLVGRGGIEIHDAWREHMSAYLGVTVSGFPNLFLLLGPNTGLGHNSVVLMIEAQVRYVMSCLFLLRRRKRKVLEVRSDTQKQFFAEVQRRLQGTVWQSGGCKSWYQDPVTGENMTLWPQSVLAYVRRTKYAALGDYTLS